MFQSKRKHQISDIITFALMGFGVVALLFLIYFYVRPIQTADIKVPVATDQASYYPGESISAIFFGETYYDGEFRILREVFCKNYRDIIEPPADASVGDYYSAGGKPRKLEGDTLLIGNLPKNAPIGSNCIIQFTNVYTITTPFGSRQVEYKYYTQNFSIVGKQEKSDDEQQDQQQQKQQNIENRGSTSYSPPAQTTEPSQSQTGTQSRSDENQTQTDTPPPAEPIEPEPQCEVNVLFLHVRCD